MDSGHRNVVTAIAAGGLVVAGLVLVAAEPLQAPVRPAPVEPAPVEPAPVEPAPAEPEPVQSAPVEPAPLPGRPPTAAELDELAERIFAERSAWATDPALVYFTYADHEAAAVEVGVDEPEVAAALPPTIRLRSGARVAIRVQEGGPVIEDNRAAPGS
ncbi:hypothetical protein [Jiangella endophytica]|uniref:hypothetical protein n=1 Tax=Jiangella endophytica TaxID=1623398 RepID=UPI0018E51907|nr:hypothetical protein [Jiangella endophytica]